MGLKTEEAADPRLNTFWREVVLPDEAPATLLPDPLAGENLLKPSNRGIFLIRTLMDEVQNSAHPEGGCVVRMKKYKPPVQGTDFGLNMIETEQAPIASRFPTEHLKECL
jgi:hypothetical protein